MKKLLLIAMLLLTCSPLAFADDDAADVRIHISGATSDNRYFLCLPNVGCLSILGAERGKVFPIYRTVNFNEIFVMNEKQEQLSHQPLPASCAGSVDVGKTITITGNLVTSGKNAHINGLHCSIT